jgi:hypothetical protein
MGGGPINNPTGGYNFATVVPTVLRLAEDTLHWFTGLTCLYDRYWEAVPDKLTLPICMFHVKKIVPIHTVEASKKRVVLYELQDGSAVDKADSLRPSVMRAITDNAVKQPVTYSMEIIVPFQPFGRYFTDSLKMLSDLTVGIVEILGGGSSAADGFVKDWENTFATVGAIAKALFSAGDALAKLPGGDGAAYINMNSLEAMADSCRTLCMKMWTGYDYKFVMITGMTYDKQANEDDIFRATLSLQEMPILAVSPPEPKTKGAPKLGALAKIVGATQNALISPLIAFTGVKDAAEDTGGAAGKVKDML